MVCARRQTMFQILKDNKSKIGMNTIANKFYHLNSGIVFTKADNSIRTTILLVIIVCGVE